jgi:hypothetical protein
MNVELSEADEADLLAVAVSGARLRELDPLSAGAGRAVRACGCSSSSPGAWPTRPWIVAAKQPIAGPVANAAVERLRTAGSLASG